MAETLPALHTDVRKVLAVHGQEVPVQQALLCCFVVAEFARMHLSGCLLPVDHLVGVQCTCVWKLLLTLVALDSFLHFARELVTLHVIMQTDLLVGREVTVCALVSFLV